MLETIELKVYFNATPQEIFDAWLDSDLHSQMTGGHANCSNIVGDSFSAWDGYISGNNIELLESKKIVQSWRTSEFSQNDEDSILVIELNKTKEGTELLLSHKNIPEGQTQYEQGWFNHYFDPMKEFFK